MISNLGSLWHVFVIIVGVQGTTQNIQEEI